MSDPNRLRSLLEQAVHAACEPSRPTGVLLSGGIDSSTIAAFAPHLPAFTGWYEGEPYDERAWARLARHQEHHEIQITPDDFITHFDDMIRAVDPPYAGPGTFGQWMVARYASEHVDVLLSGEGGDELFGGYARVYIVAGWAPPDGYEFYELPDWYPRDLQAALDYEFNVGLPSLLRVDAQVTQAHAIDAVAPMLDWPVVDYVLAQPPEERVGKRMLRDAMRGLIHPHILGRTDKRGFPVPFVEWAQAEPVRSFVHDRIGYTPDPAKPWGRTWWLELCERSADLAALNERAA